MAQYKPLRKRPLTQVGDLLVDLDFYYASQQAQPNGCVHWTASRHVQQYGMISAIRVTDDKDIMATTHRVAMRLKLGREISTKEWVIHKPTCELCCVNPAHLILGDLYDRGAAMKARGNSRLGGARGPRPRPPKRQNRAYKYSEEDIRWIRAATTREIAARHNVTRSIACRIKWAFVKGYKWVK
jgi:hypothetical protein